MGWCSTRRPCASAHRIIRVAARTGEFLVLWNEGSSLKARRVRASDGALPDSADIFVGSPVVGISNDSWDKAPFDVTFDGQDYRVLWQTPRDGQRQLFTTRVSSTGTIEPNWVSAFLESSSTNWVGIAAQGPANFLVTYAQYDARSQYNPGGANQDRTRFRIVTANDCAHDVSPPIVTCPATLRLECTFSGQTTVDMNFSDNRGLRDVGNQPQYYGSPRTFTSSVSATDHSGNTTSCETEWTVVDTTPLIRVSTGAWRVLTRWRHVTMSPPRLVPLRAMRRAAPGSRGSSAVSHPQCQSREGPPGR
jgi:hypothetical protein